MKPRIGVYLSERMATRLAAAAKRPGATKSALVEAALEQFFGPEDDVDDSASVERRLASMSAQLEQLDRNLRTVNETVALHARFHLAVTPILPAAAQAGACALGAERFEEFAAQVGRRVRLGVPLIQETMDRLNPSRQDPRSNGLGDGIPEPDSPVRESGLKQSALVEVPERVAAVREGGSLFNFPGKAGIPLH
jgi:hypothetical protein